MLVFIFALRLLRTLRDVSNHGTTSKDRIERRTSTLGRQDGQLRRMGYARGIFRASSPSTWQRACRGLFDVSHMGEIEVRGERALDLVQHVTCNDAARLAIAQAHYSGLMTEQGTSWTICSCTRFPARTISFV